jgi:hypothetical protein
MIMEMKQSEPTQSLFKFGLLLLIAGWTQLLAAFTYNDTDLLLVFRKVNFNDVEFNLGSVSNYLGHATGTTIAVTNWDLGLVQSNFNNTLDNVDFLLVSATAVTDPLRRVWLTDAKASGTPTDISGSKMGTLGSKIEFVGLQGQSFTGTNSQEVYVVPEGDVSSYTYIVSDGGKVDAASMGGLAPFPVEGAAPATNRFFELKLSNATVKPPAVQAGLFSLTPAGVLNFTAGAPLPHPVILSIRRSGNTNSVSFSTVTGGNYRLRYTSSLGNGMRVTAWNILGTTVAGDGSPKTLTDNVADAQRFYAVEELQ